MIRRVFQQEFSCHSRSITLYYVNWVSPITMLLSIWCCFVSNAAVIVALLRSEIKSIRPGLLMLCSLSFTDLFRSVILALTVLFIRLRHLLNSQVCQVYSEIETMPWASCTLITYIGTILNLTIISIDRYLAVRSVCQYMFWVTPASRPLRLYSSMGGFHCSCDW